MRQPCPSDPSDRECAVVISRLPSPSPVGRPWKHPIRAIPGGIFYAIRTGCRWRCLPHECPPWQAVYRWLRRRRLDGTREQLNAAPRERARRIAGRDVQPSAGIVDGQRVKTSGVGGPRGSDGGEKINGRERHIPVDTLGPVPEAVVRAASIRGRAGIPPPLEGAAERSPRLRHVWLDRGCTGSGRQWVEQHPGWSVEIVRHPRTWERGFRGVMDPSAPGGFRPEDGTIKGKQGFQGVLPRRRVAERAFSRLLHSRRMARDHERSTSTDEALIYAAMTRPMARRLARIHAR